jgi:periplasmic protein TonB
MFEDSLVESRAGSVSANKRWTALASISLQFAVAGIVIVLPLLHPEALPSHADTPKVLLALPPRPPVQVVRVEPESAASTSLAAPRVVQTMSPLLPGRTSANEAPTLVPIGVGMGIHDELPAAIALEASHGPSVSVAPARTAAGGPLHISSGVSQGMLIAPIRPIYPAIAKAAHVEGKVIVEAVISRTGTIESLHVVSGPPMLQRAAIDAIQAARYQPYRLNGAETAVQTTITVNFRMES